MHVIYSPRHALHATSLDLPGLLIPHHEIPQRAESIRRAIESADGFVLGQPLDYGMEPILAVHGPEFVEYLQTAYDLSRASFPEQAPAIAETFRVPGARHQPSRLPGRTGYFAFDVAAPILAGTWEAAYWSAQCAITAAQRVRDGAECAYALCRPPGHHAARDLHGGFCYLNNVAIAARWLQGGSNQAIAILDIDYHHGNGTQEIFYEDLSVLFCSIHADPNDDYPYFWGGRAERGSGAGMGHNHNWPLPLGATESDFLAALEEAAAVIAARSPGYLLVSAGFDFMQGDPVPRGGFRMGLDGLRAAASRIARLELPTVVVQEGGYAVKELGGYVVEFLRAFC